MVSSEDPEYSVEIVRLIHGDDNQHGPGFKEEVVPTGIAGSYKGKLQAIHCGSFCEAQAGLFKIRNPRDHDVDLTRYVNKSQQN
jgi:hypothetical protein